MVEKIKQAIQKADFSRHFKYGRYFLLAFGISLALLIVSYGSFTYAYKDKSLPLLKIAGQNIGNMNKGEIVATLKQISNGKNEKPLEINFEGATTSKTFTELGITVDYAESPTKVLNFGKIRGFFPSPAYIRQTLTGQIYVASVPLWVKDPEKTFPELFPDKKADPQNPKLGLDQNEVKIESEQEGYSIDVGDLKTTIDKNFVYGFSGAIAAKKKIKKSNVSKSDLEPFFDQIKKISQSRISLTYANRRTYLEREEILSFIDEERTVLEQKIVLSDQAINDYADKLSSKISQKSVTRKISSYDRSVISEGRAGIKVDNTKSRDIIKDAISNSKTKVALAVTTSDIQEEIIAPAFTPGKYPGKYIEVNLSEQNMYQFEGTNLIGTHKVSTGKWSMPTPTGEFSINSKTPRAYSQEYGLYMPYWMAFVGSQYGIHELPEWPDGTKEGEGHLGTPVSHGCIRLGRGAAQTVYDWAETGTPVYVHR